MRSSNCTWGARWCAKLRIKRVAIDFGGTWRLPPAGSGRGLWEMGVGPLKGLGAMEPKMHKGGLLIAVN